MSSVRPLQDGEASAPSAALMDGGAREPARAITITLALGCALQGLTLAWIALGSGTSLNGFLFVNRGWEEAAAQSADAVVAAAALAGLLTFHRRSRAAGALAIAAAFLTVSVAETLVAGRAFSDLNLAAAAVRYGAPVALVWPGAAGTILRLAIASTFITHGWEALSHHPGFVDLVIGSCRRLSFEVPTEATTGNWLTAIGVLDIAVGVGLLVRRWRWLALWAMVWGLVTASSRTLALGPEFLFESTLRGMNGLAPLALWFVWRQRPPTPKEDG